MQRGFLKLHRKILDWEWYNDTNVKCLFIHLLLTANIEDKTWRGINIKQGQLLTSIDSLKTQTGLSVQQVRTSLKKLETTNELTLETTNRFTVITLVNYASFNSNNNQDNKRIDKQITINQQTNNKQVTNELTTTKEVKNLKNDKNLKNIKDIYIEKISPDVIRVFEDFLENRKLLKCKETERTINLLVNELLKHDVETQIKMIENSIMNNWKSVFPLKQQYNNNNVSKYVEPEFIEPITTDVDNDININDVLGNLYKKGE